MLHPLPSWGSETWHRDRICAPQGHRGVCLAVVPLFDGCAAAGGGDMKQAWGLLHASPHQDRSSRQCREEQGDPGVVLGDGMRCAAPSHE